MIAKRGCLDANGIQDRDVGCKECRCRRGKVAPMQTAQGTGRQTQRLLPISAQHGHHGVVGACSREGAWNEIVAARERDRVCYSIFKPIHNGGEAISALRCKKPGFEIRTMQDLQLISGCGCSGKIEQSCRATDFIGNRKPCRGASSCGDEGADLWRDIT